MCEPHKLEYDLGHARMSLFHAAEAFLGKPLYIQSHAKELPRLEAAARETGHNLQIVARYEDGAFTYSRRSGLIGRSHRHTIGIAENHVIVALKQKVMDPWGNRFWSKAIEMRAATKPSETFVAA